MVLPEQQPNLGAPVHPPESCHGGRASRRRIPGIFHPKNWTAKRKRGLTMLELLCVIAIIAILAALYLGALSKGFLHIKKVLGN